MVVVASLLLICCKVVVTGSKGNAKRWLHIGDAVVKTSYRDIYRANGTEALNACTCPKFQVGTTLTDHGISEQYHPYLAKLRTEAEHYFLKKAFLYQV